MCQRIPRRSFVGGVVTLASGIAGFVVARNSAAAGPKRPTTAANGYGPAARTTGRPLATLASVPTGGGVVLPGPGVVLTRDASGAVHGFSATCTHQGCTVSSVAGGTINCPCHGSRFDVRTGAPVAGPAPRPLPAIAVVVRNGEVFTH